MTETPETGGSPVINLHETNDIETMLRTGSAGPKNQRIAADYIQALRQRLAQLADLEAEMRRFAEAQRQLIANWRKWANEMDRGTLAAVVASGALLNHADELEKLQAVEQALAWAAPVQALR